MIAQDKFGHEIKDYVFRRLLRNGMRLEANGYFESVKKANLFVKKTAEGVYFADMRGTKEVPIWTDTKPLFYWKFEEPVPPWKLRRIIKEELLRLFDVECPCRLSFEFHDSQGFEEVSTYLDEENGIYHWPTGYCELCGRDFEGEGEFCSKECEAANEELYKARCAKCGVSIDYKNAVDHHITYEPERKVLVCKSCHLKIHKSKKPTALKPPAESAKRFYSPIKKRTGA